MNGHHFHAFLTNFAPPHHPRRKRRAFKTRLETFHINNRTITRFINDFWTARQRQGGSLHEVSYRGCFKPQLPAFFIDFFTEPGDCVYDPFSGRGTTALEAALTGRRAAANDVNPLSRILTQPRLQPPDMSELADRLSSIRISNQLAKELDLSMFYHPDTEREIVSIRSHILEKEKAGTLDSLDRWIRMAATSRLTGHSPGFFSVYTLPPNQAVSAERQKIINKRRNQEPEYRNTRALILKKTRSLLRNLTKTQERNLLNNKESILLTQSAYDTPQLQSDSIALTVTSPPFLDVVQYAKDNWLRCWFNGLIVEDIAPRITQARTVKEWSIVMGRVFKELYRIARPGGVVAFEVGEVQKQELRLDETVAPLGLDAGFTCLGVMINQQEFTKTSNIWGITNNTGGTNTNRVVVFEK
jgi:hypothetical protein